MGMWKSRNEYVAIKKFMIDKEGKNTFERESFVLKKLNHPNIISLLGVSNSLSSGSGNNVNPVMILELAERGSLDRILHKQSINLPLTIQMKIGFEIACGLNYLHHLQPKIIHRDLKSNK